MEVQREREQQSVDQHETAPREPSTWPLGHSTDRASTPAPAGCMPCRPCHWRHGLQAGTAILLWLPWPGGGLTAEKQRHSLERELQLGEKRLTGAMPGRRHRQGLGEQMARPATGPDTGQRVPGSVAGELGWLGGSQKDQETPGVPTPITAHGSSGDQATRTDPQAAAGPSSPCPKQISKEPWGAVRQRGPPQEVL